MERDDCPMYQAWLSERVPGLRGSQPEGISPVNQNLYKVRVFMGQPEHSSLGFPGIFPF